MMGVRVLESSCSKEYLLAVFWVGFAHVLCHKSNVCRERVWVSVNFFQGNILTLIKRIRKLGLIENKKINHIEMYIWLNAPEVSISFIVMFIICHLFFVYHIAADQTWAPYFEILTSRDRPSFDVRFCCAKFNSLSTYFQFFFSILVLSLPFLQRVSG